MKIRNAEKSDLCQIMQIEQQSFAPQICESQNIFESRILLCQNCFIVFEDQDKKLVGYFSAERWQNLCLEPKYFALGHSAQSHFASGKILYLSSFAILPEFRGSGNGKKLFASAIDFFIAQNDGIETLLLAVNENWQGARHIYEASGFCQIARFENFFYSEKSAAIIMAKQIDSEPSSE